VGDAASAHAAVVNFWTNIKSAVYSGQTMNVEGEVATIDEATGQILSFDSVTAVTVAGTATGELLPRATQGLLRAKTNVYAGGKRIQGRVFVPYPVESASETQGVPSALYIEIVRNSGAILAGLTTATWVIYSPTKHTFAPVVGASCWDQWSVLRSRRD